MTPVTLDASGDADLAEQLADLLRKGGMTIAEGCDVVVHFNGTLTRVGRGRRRYAAQASVAKGGTVIFRYELPRKDYRGGDTAAKRFVRLLSDARKITSPTTDWTAQFGRPFACFPDMPSDQPSDFEGTGFELAGVVTDAVIREVISAGRVAKRGGGSLLGEGPECMKWKFSWSRTIRAISS